MHHIPQPLHELHQNRDQAESGLASLQSDMRSKNTTSREDDNTTVDRSLHGPSPTHMRPVQAMNQPSPTTSQTNSHVKIDQNGGTLTVQAAQAAGELMQSFLQNPRAGGPTTHDFINI
jgi:hypothetical protein